MQVRGAGQITRYCDMLESGVPSIAHGRVVNVHLSRYRYRYRYKVSRTCKAGQLNVHVNRRRAHTDAWYIWCRAQQQAQMHGINRCRCRYMYRYKVHVHVQVQGTAAGVQVHGITRYRDRNSNRCRNRYRYSNK